MGDDRDAKVNGRRATVHVQTVTTKSVNMLRPIRTERCDGFGFNAKETKQVGRSQTTIDQFY